MNNYAYPYEDDALFRPQSKFCRMPIVVMWRVTCLSVHPSVRHFQHYNLFQVAGMHIKIHMQVNHDYTLYLRLQLTSSACF